VRAGGKGRDVLARRPSRGGEGHVTDEAGLLSPADDGSESVVDRG
jgi:hypothetical protein